MKQVFRSKVDWWYYLCIYIASHALYRAIAMDSTVAITVGSLCVLMMVHMLFTTTYEITPDGFLVCRSGFFPKKTIDIREITAVEETNNLLSSYALSIDRLMLWSYDKRLFLVSPKDKQGFYSALKKRNPAIVLKKENL